LRLENVKSIDFLFILSIFFILGAGLLTIYSATVESTGELSKLYQKQIIFIGISLVFFVLIIALPQRFFYIISYLLYGISLFLLILVLVVSKGPEPARWFNFGFINFQPSEAAKLSTIIVLARFLEARKKNVDKLGSTAIAILLVALPTILVLIEPDLGTSMVFLFIAVPMMIVGGINILHLVIMIMPVIVLLSSFSVFVLIPVIAVFFFILMGMKLRLFVIIVFSIINIGIGLSGPKLWNSLHPYQQQRIKTFMNPEADPHGAGYQVIQSKVAVGSGGFWGKGYLKGTQGHLKFLPAGHTDFIFSVFCEEWGFVGASAVLMVFLLLVYRSLALSGKCRSKFSQLVLVGGASHFASHALVNTGMAIGLIPVTGLPLPFMSYGGSSLLLNMTLAGLMAGLGMRWREY